LIFTAVYITDHLCTKNGNFSFFKPKIRGLYTRAVTNQERVIMARVRYTFMDDDETQSIESTEDCIAKYSVIIDKIVNNTDLKKSHLELFKAWTGCHKEFLSKHDKDCFGALELSIPHCEKSAIQMTSDIMGEHPQTNHTISSIRKMSRSLVSNLIPTQKQFKRSTEVSTIATEGNLPINLTSEQSQN
jgi:hypothetical protein